MDQTVLEIVIERATGLKNVHWTHGLVPYPVVSICDDDGNYYYDSENKKPVDLNGGSNPVWRVLFEFNIDIVEVQKKRLHLIVRLESLSSTPCFGKPRFVGEVRVSIEKLLNDFGDADVRKSVTRSVMNEGEAHGSLTFAYKFGRTLGHPPAALPQPANGNPEAQIPQRDNDGHPIVKAAVVGVASGIITTVGGLLRDSLG